MVCLLLELLKKEQNCFQNSTLFISSTHHKIVVNSTGLTKKKEKILFHKIEK